MSTHRIATLCALLREAAVGSGCDVAGEAADIAVVRGALPDEVQPLVARIRALGFRHVSVDLATLSGDRHA
jgi:hypothetical protein